MGLLRNFFLGWKEYTALGSGGPTFFSHAFSLAGCLLQQESEEFVSAAPPLSQRGSREESQKPAVMLGENVTEGVLLVGCMSVLVFTGWYI